LGREKGGVETSHDPGAKEKEPQEKRGVGKERDVQSVLQTKGTPAKILV